jgi:hypothetical protein
MQLSQRLSSEYVHPPEMASTASAYKTVKAVRMMKVCLCNQCHDPDTEMPNGGGPLEC